MEEAVITEVEKSSCSHNKRKEERARREKDLITMRVIIIFPTRTQTIKDT